MSISNYHQIKTNFPLLTHFRHKDAPRRAVRERKDAALAYASIRPRRQNATDVQTVYPITRRQSRIFHGDKTAAPTCQILSFLIVKNG